MLPGRIFTMDGVQYRYLEDMGSDNHMIIRNAAFSNTSFNDQPTVLDDFYDELTPAVQEMVQPVAIPDEVPGISDEDAAPWAGEYRWLPAEWEQERFDEVRADVTTVNSAGSPQAFALSLADVIRLSTDEGPFPNHIARIAARNGWWVLRTPGAPGFAWNLGGAGPGGQLGGGAHLTHYYINGLVRPALIINQAN